MIEFNIKTSTDALKFLDKTEKKVDDTNPLMLKSGLIMIASIDKNFRAQGRPSKWRGLSPLTKAFRRKGRGGGNFKILQDTGRLRGSITSKAEKTKVTVGTNVEYGKLLHFGGMTKAKTFKIKEYRRRVTQTFGKKIDWEAYQTVKAHDMKLGPKKVHARPFILFQSRDIKNIEKLGLKHLEDATK